MRLSQIFIYPVKSLRGVVVTTSPVDALGLLGDRRFMIVDANGQFLTQRALPKMALVTTSLLGRQLTLSAEHFGAINVALTPDPAAPRLPVTIWKSTRLLAEDCGPDAADWIGEFLQQRCRLVRIGADFNRPILKATYPSAGNVVNFADAFPFLIISNASLDHLNNRLRAQGEEPVPMDRFRPNLVVSDCPPFAEDTRPRFRIGEITFISAGPCARCRVTTIDQRTAETSSEPLRTLAAFRRELTDSSAVNFGQNLLHETKTGALSVGDAVESAE